MLGRDLKSVKRLELQVLPCKKKLEANFFGRQKQSLNQIFDQIFIFGRVRNAFKYFFDIFSNEKENHIFGSWLIKI